MIYENIVCAKNKRAVFGVKLSIKFKTDLDMYDDFIYLILLLYKNVVTTACGAYSTAGLDVIFKVKHSLARSVLGWLTRIAYCRFD